MNMKMGLFYNIALSLVLVSCVQASLYPTHPIKNTVYLAGKAARIMWIEGGGKPLLKKMGTVQIDLYTNHDTYVSTLAKNVPATAGSTTCFIPADVPSNALSFNLRFVTTSPPSIIYTADFSILGGTGDPVYPLTAEEDDDPTADNGDGGTHDPSTTTPDSNPNDPQDPTDPTITDPNSPGYKDPNAQPNPTSNSTDTNSSTSGPPPAVSTIIAPPLGKGEVGSPAPTPTPTPNTISGSGSGSGTSRLPYSAAVRSDLESLGFRTAIVLWPAVAGISMAL